jgi:hypothetical protein
LALSDLEPHPVKQGNLLIYTDPKITATGSVNPFILQTPIRAIASGVPVCYPVFRMLDYTAIELLPGQAL